MSTRFKPWLTAALLSLAALSGCTSAPQTTQLLATPDPNRALAVALDEVPFFAQEEYQCGPAALAMTLSASGIHTRPEALVEQVYLPARKGSLQPEMLASARRAGRLPYAHPPRLKALLATLDAGYPVLVLQNLGLDSLPHWHYAVLIGYDLNTATVRLHSGVTQAMTRPMDLFEQTWRRGGYWAISLLDPAHVPPSHLEPKRYLKAALELNQAGLQHQAEQALASATEAWPQSPLPWLLSGNQLHARGRYPEAEAAFRRALDTDPQQAPAWNNLAYSLAAQGCVNQAREAAACAVQLAPDSDNFKASLAEMAGLSQPPVAQCLSIACPTPASSQRQAQ
ncbi:PA2778 family cysteine peptidase [Motiliproteus sp. SC1-56]|uniref:PA2778 family cysteine peptidase n=1 Tax=Motiliproteus sp. SC1-56 TaxID=2799565 RepID=UPI001A906B85|nr:PA2778 family cysteine peptidase [Motiliproteus sp. SC1-56]